MTKPSRQWSVGRGFLTVAIVACAACATDSGRSQGGGAATVVARSSQPTGIASDDANRGVAGAPRTGSEPGALLEVLVLDAEGDAPIETARVLVQAASYVRTGKAIPRLGILEPVLAGGSRVSDDGTLGIEVGPDADFYFLTGRAPGYVDCEGWVARTDVLSGATMRLLLRLRRGVVVKGQVVNERSREPAADAVVLATFEPEQRPRGAWAGQVRAVSDRFGRFTLDAVPTSTVVQLQATAPGFALCRMDLPVGHADAQSGANLELRRPCSVEGVVLRDGDPVGGAVVFASLQSESDVSLELSRFPWPTRVLGSGIGRAAAGDNGEFDLSGLEVGRKYTLYAVAESPIARALVSVKTPRTTGHGKRLELQLVPFPTVRVKLMDASGPVAQREVHWYLNGDGRYSGRTDADGWAVVAPELGGLAPGSVTLGARVRGYAPAEFVVDVPRTGRIDVERRLIQDN